MTAIDVPTTGEAPPPAEHHTIHADERISHRGPMRRWLMSPEIGALIGAIIVSGLLQLSVVTLPFAQPVFEVATHLSWEWLLIGALALTPVTIIEYASMTCPHCAAFAVQTFPKLKEKYIDTGKVKYIMREYPLDGLAAAAFMLARCAGPDKYYPLIETLFAQQQKWAVKEPIPPLLAIAKQAGFTQQTFETCINDKAQLAKVQQVRDRGSQKFKVEATPTFYINGERHSGSLSIEEFDKLIAPLIKS